ncbi:hypothetical protein Dsin_014013 [Dipteronia sinensis]|uniref:Uncharacterized protein n=1 Tax=Dipteronia sinensis TaxID=43782 RepID=A0AAE0E9F4_9ROSI|nr:hypothetical protein Dsin_014013 [Dipteronia sinensis]
MSESSSRHSLDIPRSRSVTKGDKDGTRRSYSDMGSSHGGGYRKFNMSRHSASDLGTPVTPENQNDLETDLVKFAEVLQNSRGRRGKLRRNSTSTSFSFG